MKRALRRLKLFEPPAEGITGIPDGALFRGIRTFRKRQGLTVDGAMATEVWRESWSYCDVHFGDKKLGDVPWRGEGAFCTPAPLSSLVLFSVMAGLLLLSLYACFVSVVAVVLALFSNPAQRRSGRV